MAPIINKVPRQFIQKNTLHTHHHQLIGLLLRHHLHTPNEQQILLQSAYRWLCVCLRCVDDLISLSIQSQRFGFCFLNFDFLALCTVAHSVHDTYLPTSPTHRKYHRLLHTEQTSIEIFLSVVHIPLCGFPVKFEYIVGGWFVRSLHSIGYTHSVATRSPFTVYEHVYV